MPNFISQQRIDAEHFMTSNTKINIQTAGHVMTENVEQKFLAFMQNYMINSQHVMFIGIL